MSWLGSPPIEPIITYFLKLHLFAQPLTVLGVLASSIVAYFTLLNHLGDSLNRLGPDTSGDVLNRSMAAITTTRKILKWLYQIGMLALVLLLVRCYLPYGDTIEAFSPTGMVIFGLSVLMPVNFIGLGLIGIVVEEYVFECKREKAELDCKKLKAVIYMKEVDRPLKGSLLDMRVLNRAKYFPFKQEDGSTLNLETSQVGTIFLQEGYKDRRALSSHRFDKGPQKLTVSYPHNETFPDSWYFTKNGFTVLKIDKPTTNSRFAIVNTGYVR